MSESSRKNKTRCPPKFAPWLTSRRRHHGSRRARGGRRDRRGLVEPYDDGGRVAATHAADAAGAAGEGGDAVGGEGADEGAVVQVDGAVRDIDGSARAQGGWRDAGELEVYRHGKTQKRSALVVSPIPPPCF